MVRIDSYRFGEIVIDGKRYHNDVVIFPNKVKANWWRREGHVLQREDLRGIMEFKPTLLIIGTGAVGAMKVPGETENFVKSYGIDLRIMKTNDACDLFNKISSKERVVAALHLTC